MGFPQIVRMPPRALILASVSFGLGFGCVVLLRLAWPISEGMPLSSNGASAKTRLEVENPLGLKRVIERLKALDISRGEVMELLTDCSLVDLETICAQLGDEFWLASPNRFTVARYLGEAGAKNNSPVEVIAVFVRRFDQLGGNSQERDRMVRSLARGVFTNSAIASLDVRSLLSRFPQNVAIPILFGIADSLPVHPRVGDGYRFLASTAHSQGWEIDSALRRSFFQYALEATALTGKVDVADLRDLLFGSELRSEALVLLADVINILSACQQTSLQEFLVQFASELQEDQINVICASGLPPETLKSISNGLPDKIRRKLLGAYIDRLLNDSPTEAARIAQVFLPSDLPDYIVPTMLAALCGAGVPQLKTWVANIPAEKQAGALCKAFDALGHEKYTIGDRGIRQRAWVLLKASDGITGFEEPKLPSILHFAAGAVPPPSLPELLRTAELVRPESRASMEVNATASFYRELIQRDPVAARTEFDSMAPEVREKQLPLFVRIYAGSDAEGAIAWLNETHDFRTQQMLRREIITSAPYTFETELRRKLFDEEMEAAASNGDFDALVPAANVLLDTYIRFDTARAFEIIQKFPDSAPRDQMINNTVSAWATRDPVGLSEWLSELPASRFRDLAVKELVVASRDDPEAALQNASAIGDSNLREQAAIEVVKSWNEVDPKRITQALDQSPLSATEREALLRIIRAKTP